MTKIEPIAQEIVALQEVMDCFFEGSLAGYAGGGKYIPSTDIPGGKVFTLRTNKLIYSDFYVSNGPQSGGITVISLDLSSPPTQHLIFGKSVFVPLWMMQYEGRELSRDKCVISIVKEALL